MKTNYLVYKTIHKSSGKYYFGRHITKNIYDDYLGSGVLIKKLLKKDPCLKHYSKEIIKNCETDEEMIELEKQLISEKIDKDPKCINLIIGDISTIGIIKHSKQNKEKMSRNHANVFGKNNPRYGVKMLEETKDKIRKRLKGISIKTLHPSNCSCAFCPNRKSISIKTRKKMSIAAKLSENPGKFKKGHIPYNKKI